MPVGLNDLQNSLSIQIRANFPHQARGYPQLVQCQSSLRYCSSGCAHCASGLDGLSGCKEHRSIGQRWNHVQADMSGDHDFSFSHCPSSLLNEITCDWRCEARAAVRIRWLCAVSSGVTQEKGWHMWPGWASSSQKAAHICKTESLKPNSKMLPVIVG